MTVSEGAGRRGLTGTSDARQLLVYQLPWIRGVCVLAVILLHVTGTFGVRPRVDWLTGFLISAHSLARFAVPVFVALSGFHLSLNVRNERPAAFYRRTLKLLVIPYVFYSAAYVLVFGSAGGRSFRLWLWAMLHGTACYHLWFIPVIVELYLIHPFLRQWYRRSQHRGGLVVCALIVQVASGATLGFGPPPTVDNRWLSLAAVSLSFLSCIGYFLLGYLLLDYVDDAIGAIRRPATVIAAGLAWLTTAGIVAVCQIAPILIGRSVPMIACPLPVITLLDPPLSLAAFVVLTAWRRGRDGTGRVDRLVQTYGLYAYGAYYVHPFVLSVASWGLAAGVGVGLDSVVFYALWLPLGAVLTILAVKLLVKLPFTRYLA